MSDINDVYAWMDGTNLNLAMSVSQADDEARVFQPDVQYVFHVHSKAGLGVAVPGTGTETRVICTFESNTSGQCWVVRDGTTRDFVRGDPSNTEGIASASGQLRLFAGRRSDPSFFNLQGFRTMVGALKQRFGANPPLTLDAAGCPDSLSVPEATTYATQLGAMHAGAPPCGATGRDCFAELNVRIVLVQLDRSLVNVGNNTSIGVWASTHQAP